MAKAKKPRVKSNFTLLKEKRRAVEREMKIINKKVNKFNELEGEISAVRGRYDELLNLLDEIKQAMREELDL